MELLEYLQDADDLKAKYKVRNLKAFDRKQYKKEKQEQQLKKIAIMQKNLEMALRGVKNDMQSRDTSEGHTPAAAQIVAGT